MKKSSKPSNKNVLHGVKTGLIPEEHHFAHAFCFLIHDLIVQSIKEGEKAKIFDITIEKPEKLPTGNLIDWMEENGYRTEAFVLIFKQSFAALTSEFCHLLYEALSCSRKGKLSITFDLLRKAFKDILFYLEWLHTDPKDFLIRFKKDPKDLSPDGICPQKKIEIIKKAMQNLCSYWGDADFLYELRYDKKSGVSFEPLFQKANHLVTNCKEFKTEPMNFNFIFSSDRDKKSQWHFLYTLLPILMVHSYHIIEALFSQFALRENAADDLTDSRILVGFILWHEKHNVSETMIEIIKSLFHDKGLHKIACSKCQISYNFSNENLAYFYGTGTLSCETCQTKTT